MSHRFLLASTRRPAAATGQLVDALGSYRGAFIVVSHDDDFLGRLDLTTMLTMPSRGQLVQAS